MVKVSLFSQMLNLIPRDKFDRLVSRHASDKHQKGINSWTHLVAMLFCHIGGAASVRDISNGLTSTTGNLSHLGVDRVPCKSSLSYINKNRTPELFKAVYFMLLEHLSGAHKFSRSGLSRLKRKIFLADASIIPLCLKVFDWYPSEQLHILGELRSIYFCRMNLEEKRTRMLALVSDWRTSGLTQETFSAQHGIKAATFSYWVSRSKESAPAAPHFITLPSGLSKVSSQVEILYPNGVRVKVDQDLALIAQLIRL